ncbi:hypothetical protein BGZ63DRAFT_467734 [Mariannaea sp. PMI_226]|nr:hypothetical protein BGZ63DRAFT_467734 [Mariannaea sp. PMI_226]
MKGFSLFKMAFGLCASTVLGGPCKPATTASTSSSSVPALTSTSTTSTHSLPTQPAGFVNGGFDDDAVSYAPWTADLTYLSMSLTTTNPRSEPNALSVSVTTSTSRHSLEFFQQLDSSIIVPGVPYLISAYVRADSDAGNGGCAGWVASCSGTATWISTLGVQSSAFNWAKISSSCIWTEAQLSAGPPSISVIAKLCRSGSFAFDDVDFKLRTL